ncbi:MAG: hypothetical protein ABI627_10390 [Polyangiaceae bacterium]
MALAPAGVTDRILAERCPRLVTFDGRCFDIARHRDVLLSLRHSISSLLSLARRALAGGALHDVAQAAGVFLCVQRVRGEIERHHSLAVMRSLLARIKLDTRLQLVAEALDERRLLLETDLVPTVEPS